MSTSARDIRIVPDRGASTQPVMFFTGADSLSSATIVLRVLNSGTDATLSFEGDVGQLFSITDSTFGPVFSVNDVSGIPSIEVLDSGLIKLAEYNGLVRIGSAVNNENATSATTGELQVVGGVGVSRDVFVGGGMTVVGTLNASVIAGSITNAANVGITNDPSNSAVQYLTFVSGTSGNLPLRVDSSALTFVPSTNNLGIGTTNPYSRLSLVSSAATDGISLFTSTYEAGRSWGTRIWKNDTGAGIPLQIDTQQTTTWYTTIRMGHGQDTNNPALITYFNTQLAMTSGNVGVGITPTNKLHVSGDSKVAGTFVGLRQYQSGDDFRIDFVKAANDTASARFEWNGYSTQSQHLIDYFSIGLNDASSVMRTRFQIMPDGRIGLNTTDFTFTSSDNTAVVAGGIDANRVFVDGSIQLIGNNNAIVFGRGTSTFLKDEELGFGWGGGWHMTDATFLRSRNNRHVYNESPYSGSSFRNFASSYDAPNLFMAHPTDTNWTFGSSSNNSTVYWMQTKYSGNNDNNRGFRVLDVASGVVRMAVADRVTTHPNTFYRTWQNYTGSDNNPMKTWDGVLAAGSDSSGAQAFTVIQTNIPQDAFMMGGFSIEWFENYLNTNGKTSITLSGYWNPPSNGNFIGFEYTSSNPNITPTIQVGRNTATGRSVIILSHFNSNHAIVVARDLWLGYSGGDYDYGSGWSILQTASLAAYSNLVNVVARTAQPAGGGGSGSGLNADLLDGIDSTSFVRDDATTLGYIDINGGTQNAPRDATVYITATNNNDWGLIVDKFNGSSNEFGVDVRVGNAAANALRITGSGAETFRVNGAGSVFAPIYFDLNNTSFFVDPASTSTVNQIRFTSATPQFFSTTSPAIFDHDSNSTPVAFGFRKSGTALTDGANYGVLNLQRTNHNNAATTAGASLFFELKDSAGTLREYAGITGRKTEAGAGGGQLDFHNFSRNIVAWTNASELTHVSSVRAPIFFDTNDTGFYGDFNSLSRMSAIAVENRVHITENRFLYMGGTATVENSWGSRDWTQGGNRFFNARSFTFNNDGYGSTYSVVINGSGQVTASVDMRAPIFFDSNNTSFFVDPASTTRLNILTVNSLNSTNGQVGGATVPVGHYGEGHEIFSINTSWTNAQLQAYFNASNVSWIQDSTAPGGYAISIAGAANVGGVYGSGFPYIPVDDGDIFYMEVWIRDVSGTNTHYMGSNEFNQAFSSLGGNPGSFGYWTMSNNAPGTAWTKFTGYIGGFNANNTGAFELGTKYWTPMALFNYTGGGTSYISGWKVIKINREGPLIVDLPAVSQVVGVTSSLARTLTVKVNNQPQINFGSYAGAWSPAIQLQNNDNTRLVWIGSLDSGQRPRFRTGGAGLDFFTNGTTTDGGVHSALIESGSVRSPIFFDLNDTAFFIDPNSTGLSLSSNGIVSSGTGTAGGFQNRTFTSGRNRIWSFGNADAFGLSYFQGGPDFIGLHPSGSATQAGSDFWVSSQGIGQASASLRAPIFFDSNNTGYYVDPSSTTALRTVGSWRADAAAWDGEFSGKMQYHANHWYIQAADLFIYRNAGGSNVFTINQSGVAIANGDMRAPIFYDNNNTGFYTDQASTSNYNTLLAEATTVRHLNFKGEGGDSGVGTRAYSIYQEGGGWGFPFPDLRVAFHTGIKFGANPSYEGMRFYTDFDMSSRVLQVNGPSNYIYADRWINVTGFQGIYSGTNSAHFYPNNASYGSWKIDGSRNGWRGIEFEQGLALMMNYNAHGIHRSDTGWMFYSESRNFFVPGEVTAFWSDRRLKKNIKPLEKGSGLALVSKLVPSSFEWNDVAAKVYEGLHDGQPETSLIAQEVQEVLPNAVAENKAGRKVGKDSSVESYLTVKYDKITPFLIQAIKDLQAEIQELREIIKNGSN